MLVPLLPVATKIGRVVVGDRRRSPNLAAARSISCKTRVTG